MSDPRRTAIVTGASQGIGAGIVKAFVERGFNVVANSRKMTQSTEITVSDQVALVDGHIGEPATAAKIVETALSRFKSIDALVNNAGIFSTKPFTDYTAEDFKSLVSTNVEGFLYVTQLAIKQMLAQKTGGSIVTITAALARNPIRGVTAAVPMITKGGLETITQHLAMECGVGRDRCCFNESGVTSKLATLLTGRGVPDSHRPVVAGDSENCAPHALLLTCKT